MNPFESIVLGLVQGLTEFLPISSTAHLRVIPALFGWEDPGAAYSAVVQLGTLTAVVGYFFRELLVMAVAWLKGLWRRRPFEDSQARMAWVLLLGTVPVGVFGLLFQRAIETTLRSLWVVAGALIGLALLLALAEALGRRQRSLAQVGWRDGLLIGAAQALALIPGASRSGVSITAGLFAGLNRADAARFSFLLSVPAVAASGLYQLFELAGSDAFPGWEAAGASLGPAPLLSLLLATLAAAVSGYLAIAGLIRFLIQRSTRVFILYRLLLGGLILGLIAGGALAP